MYAILWVFIFSIRYRGQPLFYYANETIVQNTLVRSVDDGLADLWRRLERAAKVAMAKNTPDDPRSF